MGDLCHPEFAIAQQWPGPKGAILKTSESNVYKVI